MADEQAIGCEVIVIIAQLDQRCPRQTQVWNFRNGFYLRLENLPPGERWLSSCLDSHFGMALLSKLGLWQTRFIQ